MIRTTTYISASGGKTPVMIPLIGSLMLSVKLEYEVGDEVPVVDILDGGKHCLKGAKESYLVPPSLCGYWDQCTDLVGDWLRELVLPAQGPS